VGRKRNSVEEVINKLRQADVGLGKGNTVAGVCKVLGIGEQTYFRWRREGLKVPRRQPKRGRLWLNGGSCVRLRPGRKDHVWAYDFVSARTHDGLPLRMLVIVDEFTRECLSIDVARSLSSDDVLERLAWLMATRGVPQHLRSDNGPEMTAKVVRGWLGEGRRDDALHRAGQPVGERIRRELQRQAARPSAQRRDLAHGARGQGAHRAMAAALQHGPAALIAGLPATGSGDDRCRSDLRFAPFGPAAGDTRAQTLIDCGTQTGGRSQSLAR